MDKLRKWANKPQSNPSRLRLLCAAFALWLTLAMGCGGGVMGEACDGDQLSCAQGLFCDVGAPGGYCTMACAEDLPCPNNTLCVKIQTIPDGPEPPVLLQRCLVICGVDGDCRTGYKCYSPENTQSFLKKVCFPQEAS